MQVEDDNFKTFDNSSANSQNLKVLYRVSNNLHFTVEWKFNGSNSDVAAMSVYVGVLPKICWHMVLCINCIILIPLKG